MQLRYVFSETTSGLRRNVSMSIALIVTIFVSLTLVGMGLLLGLAVVRRHLGVVVDDVLDRRLLVGRDVT